MKYRNVLFLLALLSSETLFAAQEVVREIGGSGNWAAAEVKDHELWRKDACVASTLAKNGSSLEVYAERILPNAEMAEGTQEEALYGEPTIQIVTKVAVPYVRATLEDDKKKVLVHLTLASTSEPTPVFGLLARLDDRKKILDLLKKANAANVILVDEKNRVVEKMQFSLKGSTKTIDAAFKACGLGLK